MSTEPRSSKYQFNFAFSIFVPSGLTNDTNKTSAFDTGWSFGDFVGTDQFNEEH